MAKVYNRKTLKYYYNRFGILLSIENKSDYFTIFKEGVRGFGSSLYYTLFYKNKKVTLVVDTGSDTHDIYHLRRIIMKENSDILFHKHVESKIWYQQDGLENSSAKAFNNWEDAFK